MGSITFGIPRALTKGIAHKFNSTLFVETGTYFGETAKWASNVFETVITCEPAPKIYARALESTLKISNISVSPLESVSFLKANHSLVASSNAPVFWLDSHPKGGDTYGIGQPVPLLKELDIIFSSHPQPFILIDDIRIFACPEYFGFTSDHWPSIQQITSSLPNRFRYYQVGDVALILSTTGSSAGKLFEDLKEQERSSYDQNTLYRKLKSIFGLLR